MQTDEQRINEEQREIEAARRYRRERVKTPAQAEAFAVEFGPLGYGDERIVALIYGVRQIRLPSGRFGRTECEA